MLLKTGYDRRRFLRFAGDGISFSVTDASSTLSVSRTVIQTGNTSTYYHDTAAEYFDGNYFYFCNANLSSNAEDDDGQLNYVKKGTSIANCAADTWVDFLNGTGSEQSTVAVNHDNGKRQWQPVVFKFGSELWCLSSTLPGANDDTAPSWGRQECCQLILSKLSSADGQWVNEQLEFGGTDDVTSLTTDVGTAPAGTERLVTYNGNTYAVFTNNSPNINPVSGDISVGCIMIRIESGGWADSGGNAGSADTVITEDVERIPCFINFDATTGAPTLEILTTDSIGDMGPHGFWEPSKIFRADGTYVVQCRFPATSGHQESGTFPQGCGQIRLDPSKENKWFPIGWEGPVSRNAVRHDNAGRQLFCYNDYATETNTFYPGATNPGNRRNLALGVIGNDCQAIPGIPLQTTEFRDNEYYPHISAPLDSGDTVLNLMHGDPLRWGGASILERGSGRTRALRGDGLELDAFVGREMGDAAGACGIKHDHEFRACHGVQRESPAGWIRGRQQSRAGEFMVARVQLLARFQPIVRRSHGSGNGGDAPGGGVPRDLQ